MQKRLIIAIAVALILVIVLAACSSSDAKDAKKQSPPVTRLDSCENLTADWEQENCYISAAINESNEKYCDFIVDRTHNVCLNDLSEAINDVILCDAIVNDTYWADICYKKYAEKNADEEFCSRITHAGDRDKCFGSVALDKEAVDLCAKVKDVKKNQQCIYDIAQATQNEQLCELLIQPFGQDVCYLRLAKLKGESAICDLIGYNIVRDDCRKAFDPVVTGPDASQAADSGNSTVSSNSAASGSSVNAS